MRYEVELNTDGQSVERIKGLFQHLYDILMIQREDSFKGIEGGASPHYIIKIDVNEKWV